MKKRILILVLLLGIVLSGCSQREITKKGTNHIRYYYDKEHDVCIWENNETFRSGITALPASQVRNPENLPAWFNSRD